MRAKTDFASFETSGWGRSDNTLLDRLASTPGLAANEVLRYTRVLGAMCRVFACGALELIGMFDANQGDAREHQADVQRWQLPAIYAGIPDMAPIPDPNIDSAVGHPAQGLNQRSPTTTSRLP